MNKQKKCANAACDCIPSDGSKYCSAFCEGSEDNMSIVCRCGHAHCDGDVTSPTVHNADVANLHEGVSFAYTEPTSYEVRR